MRPDQDLCLIRKVLTRQHRRGNCAPSIYVSQHLPFPPSPFFFFFSLFFLLFFSFTSLELIDRILVYTQLCISNSVPSLIRIYLPLDLHSTSASLFRSYQSRSSQRHFKDIMASHLIRICAISIFALTIQAEQMFAVAPMTALSRRDGFGKRPQFGHCPAATQTLCPDHIGCCPNGAACTQSRGIPVCDEACNGGPSCPLGGCCQIGYVCGTTNNFCTPAATAHPQHAIEAPVTTTGSASVVTSVAHPVEHVPVSTPAETATATASTTTITPKQAAHELSHEIESTESTTIKASTPIVRASSSHRAAGAIVTATTATASAHDGSRFVGNTSVSETKGPSPSAQATSSGATFVFISGTNGFLVGMVLGWLVSYCVLIQ